jgi:hypothetical protein
MPTIPTLSSFTPRSTIASASMNSNFTNVRTYVNTYAAWLDAASQTFTGNITINPSAGTALTITDGGLTVTAGGVTVSANGITVTGNSTITGTLGGVTTLTCTTVTATNLGGTLSTAAQPNVTSVGTLSALTMGGGISGVTTLGASGVVTLSATGACLTFSGATPQIRAGATQLSIMNNAGSAELARFTTSGNLSALYGNSGTTQVSLGTSVTIESSGAFVYLGGANPATTATANLPAIPAGAGPPTGVLSGLAAGTAALYVDSTNHKLYFYDGAWRDAGP